MRFKSVLTDGYQIFAVTGNHVVSFGMDTNGADTSGLLGFSVERHDLTENERYYLKGFKVFQEIVPEPFENLLVSTFEHPVQSCVWDDFTAKPGHRYDYYFYPVKGKPKFLERQNPIIVKVKTEPLFTNTEEHDVFFNRGAASSQEYARRFKNIPPDSIINSSLKTEAFKWLARGLDDAFYKFIGQAGAGDSLFGCFYEFHYKDALDKFKEAIDRGVKVKLIVDCKDKGSTDSDGNNNSFPMAANKKAIDNAIIPSGCIIQRTANKSAIAHNKFLLFQPNGQNCPTQVWTGSANISKGGIFGQTNVGHWVKNKKVACLFKEYWDLLATDPGNKNNDSRGRKNNKSFKECVTGLSPDIDFNGIMDSGDSILPIFSPRTNMDILDTYFALIDNASHSSYVTLAFGVNKGLKDKLIDNTFHSPVVFLLLEKKDAPAANSRDKQAFIMLKPANNVYEAYGSYFRDSFYKWAKETTTGTPGLGLNSHVRFIHTKFLLHDPLGPKPVIVTGSANFSEASTTKNDENMLIIKNNFRASDIYFTEFNRLFNHYYYRSVIQELKQKGMDTNAKSVFLDTTDEWLANYKTTNSLKKKKLDIFRNMSNINIL